MVIYGEYLFLENTITGFFILYLTGNLLNERRCLKRIFAGGICCGLYGFIIFIPDLPPLLVMCSKLAFSGLVCLIAFRPSHRLRLARQAGAFFLVSFAMGGATLGVMYLLEVKGVTYNGSIYMKNPQILFLILGCGIAYIGIRQTAENLKRRKLEQGRLAAVKIAIAGKSLRLLGMVDTGNFLRDPVSRLPVFLVEKKAIEGLTSGLAAEEWQRRMRWIPFTSVGKEKGSLIGLRPDWIGMCVLENESDSAESIQEERFVEMSGILGLYGGRFGLSQGGEPYSVLLHPESVERSFVCHG